MGNQIYVSIATIWEMSIEEGAGRLRLGRPLDAFLDEELDSFDLLGIAVPHALATASLPRRHGDPFDRMLVAQAQTENLPLISKDGFFDAYGVQRIWK